MTFAFFHSDFPDLPAAAGAAAAASDFCASSFISLSSAAFSSSGQDLMCASSSSSEPKPLECASSMPAVRLMCARRVVCGQRLGERHPFVGAVCRSWVVKAALIPWGPLWKHHRQVPKRAFARR